MSRPIWFKRKTYGYGWYPATWQGWLVILAWVCLVVLNGYRLDPTWNFTDEVAVYFSLEMIVLSIILIGVCWYTGETPRWQWGKKD